MEIFLIISLPLLFFSSFADAGDPLQELISFVQGAVLAVPLLLLRSFFLGYYPPDSALVEEQWMRFFLFDYVFPLFCLPFFLFTSRSLERVSLVSGVSALFGAYTSFFFVHVYTQLNDPDLLARVMTLVLYMTNLLQLHAHVSFSMRTRLPLLGLIAALCIFLLMGAFSATVMTLCFFNARTVVYTSMLAGAGGVALLTHFFAVRMNVR